MAVRGLDPTLPWDEQDEQDSDREMSCSDLDRMNAQTHSYLLRTSTSYRASATRCEDAGWLDQKRAHRRRALMQEVTHLDTPTTSRGFIRAGVLCCITLSLSPWTLFSLDTKSEDQKGESEDWSPSLSSFVFSVQRRRDIQRLHSRIMLELYRPGGLYMQQAQRGGPAGGEAGVEGGKPGTIDEISVGPRQSEELWALTDRLPAETGTDLRLLIAAQPEAKAGLCRAMRQNRTELRSDSGLGADTVGGSADSDSEDSRGDGIVITERLTSAECSEKIRSAMEEMEAQTAFDVAGWALDSSLHRPEDLRLEVDVRDVVNPDSDTYQTADTRQQTTSETGSGGDAAAGVEVVTTQRRN